MPTEEEKQAFIDRYGMHTNADGSWYSDALHMPIPRPDPRVTDRFGYVKGVVNARQSILDRQAEKFPTAAEQGMTPGSVAPAPAPKAGPLNSSVLGSQLVGVDPMTLIERLKGIAAGAINTALPSGDTPNPNAVPPMNPQQQIGATTGAIGAAAPLINKLAAMGSRAALNAVTTPENLMARAASNRATVEPAPSVAADAVTALVPKAGIARVASKPYRAAAAPFQEMLARFASANDSGPSINMPTPNGSYPEAPSAPPMTKKPFVFDRTPENRPPIPVEPTAAAPMSNPSVERPPAGVSFNDQTMLDKLRNTETPEQLYERQKAARDAEILPEERRSSPVPTPATPAPDSVSFNDQTMLDKLRAGWNPRMDSAPAVNKWMNIPAKEVISGANPGRQVIQENLLGPTKEITKVSIDNALADAGSQLDARLQLSPVTIDAQTAVYDELSKPFSGLLTPDAPFQQKLNGLLDKIEERYPDLGKLSARQTQNLRSELSNAIKWSGEAYDSPINQAMVKLNRSLGRQLGDAVPGAKADLARWQNLHVASKSLQGISIPRDIVGSGTGPQPVAP